MITNILVIACPVWGVLARFAAAAVGDVAVVVDVVAAAVRVAAAAPVGP
jgi:hypothetical protein